MQNINLFTIYADILNENNFQYFITGAVASIVYGETRLTHDIDLVIYIDQDNVSRFINSFPPDKFYCPPEEVIRMELNRATRGHFNLIHHETGFKADFYFTGQDELQHWGLKNRKQIEFLGTTLYVAPPEYIIIKKLQYYREGKSQKHIVDIQGILENSNELINYKFLLQKISELKLGDIWKMTKDGMDN